MRQAEYGFCCCTLIVCYPRSCFIAGASVPLPSASALQRAETEQAPARRACKIAANDPAGAEVHAGLELPPGSDGLRSSASSSTCDSCFASATDTVVITGQPVADPRRCICTRANRGPRAHWCKGRAGELHREVAPFSSQRLRKSRAIRPSSGASTCHMCAIGTPGPPLNRLGRSLPLRTIWGRSAAVSAGTPD